MDFSTFLIDTLGLSKLPPHLPTLLYSFLGFLLIHRGFAPWGSRKWFPEAYNHLSVATKNSWCIHVVSQVHTAIIVPLALWIVYTEPAARVEDRAFGWTEETGFAHAISCGYFLWDIYDSVVNFVDIGFVIHAVACFLLYTMTFKPFVVYYATRGLVWEASTFFLNNHWFLDKLGKTGSTVQLINAMLLLATFFGVRIVYGIKWSYNFMWTLIENSQEIPGHTLIIFGVGNITLQVLSWIWFSKMINAVRRRFKEPSEKERVKVKVNLKQQLGDIYVKEEAGKNGMMHHG